MRGSNTLPVGSVLGMLLAFALGLSLLDITHIDMSSLYYRIPCFPRNDGPTEPTHNFLHHCDGPLFTVAPKSACSAFGLTCLSSMRKELLDDDAFDFAALSMPVFLRKDGIERL